MALHGLGLQPGHNHEQNSGASGESKIDYKLECLTCEKRLAQSGKKEALGGSDSSFPMLTGKPLISRAVFRNSASPKRAFDNRSGGPSSPGRGCGLSQGKGWEEMTLNCSRGGTD